MKTYTIRSGFSFVMPNGDVKGGGDTVDLPDDVADQHLHKLESEPEPEPKAKRAFEAPPANSPTDLS